LYYIVIIKEWWCITTNDIGIFIYRSAENSAAMLFIIGWIVCPTSKK